MGFGVNCNSHAGKFRFSVFTDECVLDDAKNKRFVERLDSLFRNEIESV